MLGHLRKLRRRARRALVRIRPAAPWPPYPSVALTQWRSSRNVPNFGDDLSSVIVSLILAEKGRTLEDEAHVSKELAAIGSILHLVKEGAVIWGSGVNGKVREDAHEYSNLDVRAVRGPYTREWLWDKKKIQAPEVYGDPALLLPRLTRGRFVCDHTVRHVFVPNLNDIFAKVEFALPDGVKLVSPMQSWHEVVRQITGAQFVSASSLHGIIIAEAFGIPARCVRLSNNENVFKFNDYYAGTGRFAVDYARSVEEAFEMGGVTKPVFSDDALMEAFPRDLWI